MKIPLVDRTEENINIPRERTLDSKLAEQAAVSDIKNEDRIFSDLLNLGKGFLEIRQKEEEENYDHDFSIWKKDIDKDIEDIYIENQGKSTPAETYNKIVKPFLDTAWGDFLKNNNYVGNKQRTQEWETKKQDLTNASLLKQQEFNSAKKAETEVSSASNVISEFDGDFNNKDNSIVQGAKTIYSSSHIDDPKTELDTAILEGYSERMAGLTFDGINEIIKEINNLQNIEIPATEIETTDLNGNLVTLKKDKQIHDVSDVKYFLMQRALKARANATEKNHDPFYKTALKSINDGNFDILRKNSNNQYIDNAVSILPKAYQQDLESAKTIYENTFYEDTSMLIDSLASTEEAQEKGVRSPRQLNKLLLELHSPNLTADRVEEIHNEIRIALLQTDNGKLLYPPFFIKKTLKTTHDRLGSAYRNIFPPAVEGLNEPPDTQKKQYFKGISDFASEFQRLSGILPNTMYNRVVNNTFTGFYESWEGALSEYRKKNKNATAEDVSIFTKEFINNRLLPMQEAVRRKELTGEESYDALFGKADNLVISEIMQEKNITELNKQKKEEKFKKDDAQKSDKLIEEYNKQQKEKNIEQMINKLVEDNVIDKNKQIFKQKETNKKGKPTQIRKNPAYKYQTGSWYVDKEGNIFINKSEDSINYKGFVKYE